MPCRIKIKQNLYDKVVSMTNEAARHDYSNARKVAREVNKIFGTTVVEFVLALGESILQRNIYIPSSLVDEYYQNEVALEFREAELLSYNDAQRAGVEYDDRYLFGVDDSNIQKLEFNLNTLNAVDNFLKAVGVDKRLVPNFLAPDGSVIRGAIAAANFIQGTVDIADQSRTSTINDSNLTDQEKSELIANFWKKVDSKMPEEAAHFWYRLLKEDSPLKKMLWESHKTALKADALYKGKYGRLPGIKSAEDLTEEAVGQLIAEAIKRVENKNASNEDYSFFKKFLEWINSILGKYQTIEEDPFEVAAIKILTSDVSDLLSFEEYNALHNIVYPDAVLTPQSVKPIDYSIIEDLVDYRADWVEYGDNIVPEYTLRIKGDVSVFEDKVVDIIKFNTKEEMDDYVYKNFGDIHDNRQKEILQEVRDNEVFFDRLLNKTYKRKSKYLSKTLRKYYQITTTNSLRTLSDWEVSVDSFTINKKLSKDEKQMLEETTGYKNISPTLKVLPLILQKYKKNPISLSEKLKVDGIKKEESHIIETIKDLIKKENPDKKTITAEELVSEVHKFLSTNYMLGFGNETYYPDYNVRSTFKISSPEDYSSLMGGTFKASASESFLESLLPERRRSVLSLVDLTNQQQQVFHNRISLKFNDKFFHNAELYRKFDRGWHTYTPYAPSAWTNLTYFYTGDAAYKDAALLHEIQNNNKEFLDSFDPASLTLDQELNLYINDLNDTLLQNLETLKLQGYKIERQYPTAPEQQSLFGNTRIGYFLFNRLDSPESVVFNDLKTTLQEQISFYDSQVDSHPSSIYKKIDKAYSNKRRIQDLKKKHKGLKSLLTPEQIREIQNIIKEVNAEQLPGRRDRVMDRKRLFKDRINVYENILNEKMQELYGKDSPLIYLDAPAKPLPANLRENNVTARGQRYGNSASTLNENIDFLFIHSENKLIEAASKQIAELKSNLPVAYGEQSKYRFNQKLIKITKEQFHTLFENFKFNQNLLDESIKIQSNLDLQAYKKKGFLSEGPGYDYFEVDGITYTREIEGFDEERYFKQEYEITKDEFYEAFEKSENKIPTPEGLTLKVENLIKKATDKKEELDKSLTALNQDLAKSLETELGYFTPLVNFAIKKHIKQAGKETPLYFSGFNITLLTQGEQNYTTAAIYAGKEEVSIYNLNKDRFVFNGKTYIKDNGYTDKYSVVESETGEGTPIEITSQDYERAYNLASVKAIKQIKLKAAESIFGINQDNKEYYEQNIEKTKSALALSDRDFIIDQRIINIDIFDKQTSSEQNKLVKEERDRLQKTLDYYQEKLDNSKFVKYTYSESELDEILLRLNDYKKKSENNRREVAIQTLFENGNKPLEPGAIYVALSKIPGVKLIWQPSIKGIANNTGGYLVDLTNYNFTPDQEYAPPLYGLDEEEESFINDVPSKKGISNISSLGKLEGDLMESEKGQIGVNKQQLLMLLGPTMYNKPLAQVAVKELLQNSFDAVKARMNITDNKKTGNIDIKVDYDNRTISIKDDGIGMTPEIVKNAFLSIGGTNKEGLDVSERSGGFGLAKVQFLLGSEYVKVITVRDGIKTSLEATAIQLYNDDFTINKEQTDEPNGSYVEVKIPESYTTPEGTKREIDFPGRYKSGDKKYTAFDILDKPLIGNVNVSFTYVTSKQEYKKVLPIGENTTEETLPPLFSKIDFSWGSADLYMSIDKKERPSHKILSSGIYQFNYPFSFKQWENIPYDIVVNIKPSVSSTSEQYPFNNQRENFKNTVVEDIKSLNNYLKKYAFGEAEKDAKAVFSNITGLPKVDPNKVLTPEEREKLYAEVEKNISENNRLRLERGYSSAEEELAALREVAKLIINEEGVKNAETGKIEVSKEKQYGSSFKAEKEIEKVDAIDTVNFNPELPQYHNNTNFNYLEIPGAAEFFSDFGSVVLEMVRFAGNELGYDYRKLKSEDEKFFAGVSIDKQYGGVHVRKVINAIFVNPLAFDVSSMEEAVGVALHVAIHEINHTTVSGEGASFTTALGILYGKIYATGKYGLYEGLFRSVYKKHFETFNKLKYEYDKSSTKNLSESFSGDQIERSPARNVQRDVNDVPTRKISAEGDRSDQISDTGDKTGDVILSKFEGLKRKVYFSRKKEEVNYMLKAVNILNSKSGVKMFEKAAKADWPLEKTLTELQVPKEQKELILNLGKTDREEIITDLLANYSYTVEINTAKEKNNLFNVEFEFKDEFIKLLNDYNPNYKTKGNIVDVKLPTNKGNGIYGYTIIYDSGGFYDTDTKLDKRYNQFFKEFDKPTQYYSNLTVPGGTNYTENEVATPAITPSIKGHAQFATDKGIGWFRSDEQVLGGNPEYGVEYGEDGSIYEDPMERVIGTIDGTPTKTRRILEVQSDLFQKGRDKKSLTGNFSPYTNGERIFTIDGRVYNGAGKIPFRSLLDKKGMNIGEENISEEVFIEAQKRHALIAYGKENQFLQLLNKDNNWVTFFVKSIIQDSAKKGYEKVLFPSGNTASKVEGHTTLEQFKKQKQDRIKDLEKAKQKRFDEIPYVNDELIRTTQKLIDKNIGNKEENIKKLNEYKKQKEKGVDVSDIDNEINQLKQELERVETEGFGALKPIFNFYENTVTNVLRKQGFSPKVITDEYGNTWNEVEITPEYQGDILFSTLSKNEIRRKLKEILADVTLDTEEVTSPIVEQSTKVKAPAPEAVVARMQEILKVLGIKVTIGNLPVDIAAMADILNRTITFAQGQLTADNLTEEVLHFIVDIVETKYPEMFQSLMNEIIKYPTYTDVLNRYGDFSEYQRPDGSRDLYKLKKEAIAQVLVEKLLSTQNIQDKGYIDAAWNAIVRFLNKLFGQLPFQVRDSFAEMTEQIFNSDFITENDRKFLNNADFFYAAKGNRMQRELGKTKFLFGGPSEKGLSRTSTPYEVWSYIKSRSTRLDKVIQIETNADGEQEEVEYYETNTGIKQRITSFLKEVSKNLYSNVDKSARAELKRQAKMQKGTQVHQTIEDIVNRLIDDQTGLLRATPEPRPENLGIEVEAYNMLEYYFTERVRSYPQGTRFLTETRVVYEEAGLAGTIDFIAISPTKAGGFTVDVLDWKTTDMKYSDYGIQKIRADISPYNQQYWRDQLELYKSSLISYGIPAANFRKTWAIPIIVEVDIKKLDKNLPLSEDNKLVTIKNMKIGALDPSNIPSEDFGTVPVGTQSAYTGSEIVDKTVANLWEIYKRIKATPYSDAQRLKKRKDLDDILAAIKELQIQKKAKKFVVLFDSSFIKYRELLKEKPKFLKTLSKEQKLMSEEQNTELNNYISDLYDAIEFLSAFDDFSSLINELYPSASLSEEGQAVIRQVKNVGYNSNDLKEKLMKQAEDVIDELGVLYDIDQVSSLDVDSHKYGKFLVSLLHREERTIQLAGRMINAMVFLGQLESKKYFDPKEGRFAVVFNNFKNWANSKNISIEEAYKKLFRREVLEFVYRGKTYSKKKDKFLKDGKEIEGSVFFDTMYSNKSKIKVTKYGREESLIPMIDSTFFDVLEEKRKEMNERLEFIIDELSTKRLTGKAKMSAAKSIYTKEILPFLEENFDLDAYKTAYKEAYDKFVQSAKVISFDPDPVIDVTKRERFIDDWIAAHDVFTSPRALSDRNWLLKINESKWISPEYRVLSQKGNEPLLEVYKLFTDINQRALKAGMLTNTSSPLKFLPLVEDANFLKALKLTARDFKNSENKLRITLKGLSTVAAGTGVGLVIGPAVGTAAGLSLAGYWLNKSIKAKFEELTAPQKEGKYIKEASAITGSVKRERKVLFKNVENEEYLSKDLFRNYALWADHVIKFEVVSAFEERFEMLQLVERKKERIVSTDVYGNIAYATTATGITDLSRKATETKRSTTQADLSNFIDNYLYETSLEYKPPYYKLFMYLKDAAGATYLGLRPTLWIANLLGGSSSGGLLQGTKFRPGDFEKSMASTFGMKGATKATVGITAGAAVAAISPFSPILAGTVAGAVFAKTAGTKLADMIFNDSEFERKKNFLYNLLGTRIKSEYDKEEFDVFKNASTKLNSNLLYSGFRATDEWLQDGVAGALLMNTTIIDGKVVNIVEYVKKKYEKERFQTKLAQQASVTNKTKLAKKNREIEEKIDREISDMVKNKSIFSLLKPKGDSYTINGLDINSIEGQNELLKLANTVHSYIKTAIGNIDENDKSTGKLIWWSTFVYQFKNFVPRVYGSRLAGLESDYERNEVTLGRYAAFGSAFVNAPSIIIRESLKNLLPLLAYVNPTAIASGAALVAGTTASKYTQKQVKYNIDLQQAAKDKYQEEMIKWEAQGKDMTKFPTEAEYIDLYLNGVTNTLKAIQQVAFVAGMGYLIMSMAGGDDDKKAIMRLLARLLFSLDKELGADKNPIELAKVTEKLIPVVGYLTDIQRLLKDFGGEVFAEIEHSVTRSERSKTSMEKYHPYHRFMNVLPGLRELHFWLLSESKDYAEFSEVPQPRSTLK